MSGSIPQWILDIESDEKISNKKFNWFLYFVIVVALFVIYVVISGDKSSLNKMIASILLIFVMILSLIQLVSPKRNTPNLLAANLYRIGTELKNFDSSSPSFIKRNQQYLKKCQTILNDDLTMKPSYFIEDYMTFLENIRNIILQLNYFYSNNLKPTNGSISSDLVGFAESIHENYKNLQPVHTAYVEGILSNLKAIETQPLNISPINKLIKLVNTGWHNLPYSLRAVFTIFLVVIIIFTTSSYLMNNFLGMEKSLSNTTASAGSFVVIAAMITKIDKIVPR